MLSFVCAAGVYLALSDKTLRFWRTLAVQLATAFTNRLLPSGLGGLGTNMLYLKKSGNKRAAAISYVAVNNIIGFIAFSIIIVASGALAPSFIKDSFSKAPDFVVFVIVGIAALLLIGVVMIPRFRRWLIGGLRNALHALQVLYRKPTRLLGALVASMGITASFILCLAVALRGASISLSFPGIVAVFAASAIATSASPTPGGLGASELAMVIALKQLGVEDTLAIRGIISFRLASFWLPIIPGIISFRYITKKKYL